MKLEDIKETSVAIRIKGPDTLSVDGGGARPVEQVSRSAATGSATAPSQGSADSVHITASARQMAGLAQTITDTPDIDSSRVEALQQAIGQGKYSIDAGRIADKMLKLEQDLGAAG
jgi:negative regulator of flagellin synthesis FlgM